MKNKKTNERTPFIPTYMMQEILELFSETVKALRKNESENKELINKIEFIKNLIIQRLISRG